MKLSKCIAYKANIGGYGCHAGIKDGVSFVVIGGEFFKSFYAAREYLTKDIDPSSPARLEWLEAVIVDLSETEKRKL